MATDISNPLLPDDLIFCVADHLEKSTLFGLRSVSRAFLEAAKLRRDSEVNIRWPKDWNERTTLDRCRNPDVARRIRKLDVDLPDGLDNLHLLLDLFSLATNIDTLSIVGNDPGRQSKVTVPNDAWTGKFEQVTHFRLRAERLLGLHIEGLTLPKLLRFTFSNRIHSYSREDKGPRDDTLVADFIRRHGASLERIGVQFRRVLGRSFFDFEAELPNLIGIYVVGRWDEDTAPGGSALPFQNVIDKRAACLEELSIARFPPGDPSGGECSYLEDLFTRTSELSCPLALTRVKLALPFNITPTFWTWFARLLPQLTVFWLPQCILDNGKLVELVGGLRTPPPLEDLMLLSDDKIEERCETLARLFPRIDKLKFILESVTSSADYVTTMVPECEPRFKQMYLKNAVNRDPKWAATEFGIRQYPVGEISNTRLLAYLYAGHAQQGIDLRLIKVDDWPFGFY